jgi:mRNA interferase RelE/StbE
MSSSFYLPRSVTLTDWILISVIQPEPLTGQYAGQYKIRVGDYRVLYRFDRAAKTVTILKIRHRREVYE